MYESHWRLETRPFEATNDMRFYYPSESHQAALLKTHYAIENHRGAILLVGQSGMGKTQLIQQLARQLSETCAPLVNLVFPQMPADQLLAHLAAELAGTSHCETIARSVDTIPSIDHSVRRLRHLLLENAALGRHAVIVIDEAHLLRDAEVLETIRLLLNFEHEGRPTVTLVLAGQPGILSTLSRFPDLDDRIDVKCVLPRFTLEQTMGYVSHRLNSAGAQRAIFMPDALEAIHDVSQGVPRRINRLADLALVVGFAEELPVLRAAQIESVADELLVKTEA